MQVTQLMSGGSRILSVFDICAWLFAILCFFLLFDNEGLIPREITAVYQFKNNWI